jgi:hypothetical protein
MTYGNTPADYPNYRLRFYFNEETSPRLDLSIDEFFGGTVAPLEYPLVGPFSKSSHGCYCYLPFPYTERLKITLSGLPLFYNMTYHRFDSPDGVSSWTGDEDHSAVLDQWNAVGTDPKSSISNSVVSGTITIPTGATGTLFTAEQAGVIQSIKVDPSSGSTNVLSNVWIQMNWDGGEMEVNAPLGDFFGSGKFEINVTSLPIGMKTSGNWYCYFPMPYWDSARIQLINLSAEELNCTFEVQTASNTYSLADTGYFNAVFHEEKFVDNGRDFNFIDEQGRGHVVGVSLFMESSGAGGYEDMNYLEGDERAYVDGALSPCIHGTGNEDYFNCGWYFNKGVFSRPYHGHPWRDQFNGGGTNFTQAYRFHLSDSIPFNSTVKFGVEHGHGNASPGTFSSVTYFYKMEGGSSGVDLIADLDFCDSWTESTYNFQPAVGAESISNSWSYAGDDEQMISDMGYTYKGTISEFSVAVSDSKGLLLRRRTDQGLGGQNAYVFVDDLLVGTWHEADLNFSGVNQRWLDSEFMVPAEFLEGKEFVRIGIHPQSALSLWNEYRYWVYSVKSTSSLLDSDLDQIPDEWELNFCESLDVLNAEYDSDFDGFDDDEEYIAGTDPLNLSSYPAISFDDFGDGIVVQTCLGRRYSVQETSSLFSNEWKTIRHDVPGTGSSLTIPIDSDPVQTFYRFLIDKP